MKTMRLVVSTPGQGLTLEAIVALRFLADDGWRGVLPGHAPARARLGAGPLRCRFQSETETETELETKSVRWLATEGGVLFIDGLELRILTRWVAEADSLARLRVAVEARDAERARLDHEARTLAKRHEIATRRALIALERRIVQP